MDVFHLLIRAPDQKIRIKYLSVREMENKNRLKVSFPVETVPYLGILMNENGWDELYNIFIEPCTICYDRPDMAKKYGQVSKVEAFGKYKWYVDLAI